MSHSAPFSDPIKAQELLVEYPLNRFHPHSREYPKWNKPRSSENRRVLATLLFHPGTRDKTPAKRDSPDIQERTTSLPRIFHIIIKVRYRRDPAQHSSTIVVSSNQLIALEKPYTYTRFTPLFTHLAICARSLRAIPSREPPEPRFEIDQTPGSRIIE